MRLRYGYGALGMLFATLLTWAAFADEPTARSVRHDGTLYLHCGDVARVLDLDMAVVSPSRLITFCAKGNKAYCVPVRLTAANHRTDNGDLYMAAAVLGRSLHCEAPVSKGVATLRRAGKDTGNAAGDVPPYNADWGAGRGFRVGDTLPDIPLVDLQGREVRFSEFLGKRYILYCWASW